MKSSLGHVEPFQEKSDTVNDNEHMTESEVSHIKPQDFGESSGSSFSGTNGSGGKQRRRRTRFVTYRLPMELPRCLRY